ncbi:unnamed protein product [Rotaria sp. Silwood1]|nr:unnamed protein product [Rotaria sp. Silwood1]
MTETKKSITLTHEQLEAILKTDHIRKHLINVGLIDRHGDIIPKDEYRRHTRRQHTSNKKLYYPMVTSTIRRPKENISNTNEQERLQPINYNSTDRKPKSTVMAQQKQITNKTLHSTSFSSSKQSTWIENVRIRQAVSPEIMPADNRCFITMRYFGDEINIDYNRSLFIPQDDEIIIMQQHCGGENLTIFKGLLKPNDDFSFESRRHTDYPFALAFYVNGIINNRLSVCCEYRCKNDMRIGGKRGLFAIRGIEKCAPCRRCRFEERMKKLMEGESRPKSKRTRYRKPTKSRTPTRQSSTSREKISKSTSSSIQSSQKKTSDIISTKSNQSNKTDSKTNEIDNKDHSKTNGSPISSPKPIESNKEDFQTNESSISNPKPIESDNQPINAGYSHELYSERSDSSVPSLKPIQVDENNSKTNGLLKISPRTIESDNEDSSETSESSIPKQKSIENNNKQIDLKKNTFRMTSPVSIKSDTSSLEERHESPSLRRIRPMTAPSHQSKTTTSPNPYGEDFEEVDDEIHSPLSTSRENEPIQSPSSDTLKMQHKKNNDLDHSSIISDEINEDSNNDD